MHQICEHRKKQFEIFARKYIFSQNIPSSRLKKAMIYSFFNGGKRIRALLCYISGSCFQTSVYNQNLSALAIEAIHTYSLIHDDLPCMDDDNLRRGKPSCHIQFNEATAILAGDALQNLAFEALSKVENVTIYQLKKVIKLLSICSGSQGMVSGQQLDIDGENQEISSINLKLIHLYKTGKIFKAAILLPFYLSSVYHQKKEIAQKLSNFAEKLGLAFQIQDDILDLTATTKVLGKNTNSDTKLNKKTYPLIFGTKKSKKLLDMLINNSKNDLSKIKIVNIKELLKITQYILQRKY